MLQVLYQTPTELRIQKARTALLLDHPFFGSLLFRLKGRECRSIATMATDGVSLYYNPEFVDSLNPATLCGVLAHEVMHPGLHHHVRRSGRHPRRWNEACDYAINPLLLDAGLSLPDGVLVDDRYRGISAEQIFAALQRKHPERFSDGQLRTLQRRIKRWGATEGPVQEVYFVREHRAGELCESDFTHLTELGITIGGERFAHMLYHFVLTYSPA
jgi:hypothetical protein